VETHPLKQAPKELVLFADGYLEDFSYLASNQAEIGSAIGNLDWGKPVLNLVKDM
jgi:hypothetical protein